MSKHEIRLWHTSASTHVFGDNVRKSACIIYDDFATITQKQGYIGHEHDGYVIHLCIYAIYNDYQML